MVYLQKKYTFLTIFIFLILRTVLKVHFELKNKSELLTKLLSRLIIESATYLIINLEYSKRKNLNDYCKSILI
jgi:hypothetical protein